MQGINSGKHVGAIGAAKLQNYYTKDETYSQEEVNALLESIVAGDLDLSGYATKSSVEEINATLSEIESMLDEINNII